MIKKKLIILIMCSSTVKEYIELKRSIIETWFTRNDDNVEIIFYTDAGLQVNIAEPLFDNNTNTLTLPCKDGYFECAEKTLLAFDWILKNYNFEYMYRSNLGSYVSVNNMLNFLQDKPINNFYCGIVGEDTYYLNKPIKFASGSGYFLSKDLLELSLNNKKLWNFNIVDDVNLGNIFSELKIDIDNSAKRLSFCDNEVYYQEGNNPSSYINKDDIIKFFTDSKLYHIRLRSHDRNLDIQRMYDVHNLFNEKLLKINYSGQDFIISENLILEPGKHYQLMCDIPSDINEHLPVLKKYAENCSSIVEIGVRFACSTWAFIEAKPHKLRCYDINYNFFKPSENVINKICNKYEIDFKFILGDSLKIDIEETDLLFIDTLHTYNQLLNELNKHEAKVNKWIILHDIITFGQNDESIYEHASDLVKNTPTFKSGLMSAVDDFLLSNKNWKIKEIYQNNNGLGILERIN